MSGTNIASISTNNCIITTGTSDIDTVTNKQYTKAMLRGCFRSKLTLTLHDS